MDCNSLITTRKRLLYAWASVVFFFFVLIGRLACLQIKEGEIYSAKAAEQWYRDLPLAAGRGIIYDRTGNTIADNMTVYTVYVRPGSVTEPERVAEVLSDELGADKAKLKEKIRLRAVSEITVRKNVDAVTGKKLINLGLDGVYFSADYKRCYAYPEFLAQVVGFTDADNVGQNGLEGYYDKYIKGIAGSELVQSDNGGKEISTKERFYIPPVKGANVYTSLDINIQAYCEQAVYAATEEWKAKGATVAVMRANDGGIVAMAQSPSYSLDDLPRDDVEKLNAYSKNKMIVDVYEPGSTFKIFTTAIAIENGVVNDNSRFFCAGHRMVDGQRIRCWRSRGHGSQNLAEGVKNSCNCVFMDLALRLGTDKLYEGLKSFGFGAKTGVDFFGESSGLMMNSKKVKSVDLARIGFGQAIAVTPVQMLVGVCEAVNGGKKVSPHFVEKIAYDDGKTIYEFFSPDVRIIGERTSAEMRTLLENVVKEGSGKKASVTGYRIGGKTGTAQKYENGHIATGKYVSSFVGFAPADDPEYVILMTVDEPSSGAYYGSIVAAPYVGDIFSKIFAYEQIAPTDNAEKIEYIAMPELTDKSVDYALNELKKLGLYVECAGDGDTVISTLPLSETKVKKGDVVLIRTA
ncbi:MAG: PASTA domain-containing protein [Firmicutes bacterium]|nr:PASTA domain-containing protein [Bacillota bacterium]